MTENDKPTPITSEDSVYAKLYIFDINNHTIPKKYYHNIIRKKTFMDMFDEAFESLCRNKISKEYINNKVSTSHIMIGVYIEEENLNNDNNNDITTKPIGYLLGRYTKSNNIKIDLICTDGDYKGLGKQLLSIIKEIAAAKGISSLKLSAINNVKTFYTKFNFINTGPRNERTSATPMKYNLSKYTGEGGRRKTTKLKKHHSNTRRRRSRD